jgi:hypothetical protein
VWHLHNDAIHVKGEATILGSVMFLISYEEANGIAQEKREGDKDPKGKHRLCEDVSLRKPPPSSQRQIQQAIPCWKAPPTSWAKINTDGAYCHRTGDASIGVVARDHRGEVILSAWRSLKYCGSPEDVEAVACLEGVRLAKEWIRDLPVLVETGCSNLVQSLRGGGFERAQWAGILSETIGMSRLLPECTFQQVGRDANQIAHQLAKRTQERQEWVVMRHDILPELCSLFPAESARDVPDPVNCNMLSGN